MEVLVTNQRADRRSEKRKRLTEIVAALGPDATTEQIREEGYKSGYGAIHWNMLSTVRNELWPGRRKHGRGFTKSDREIRFATQSLVRDLIYCPKCGSTKVWTMQSVRPKRGGVTRHRQCQQCGDRHKVYEEVDSGPLANRQMTVAQWALITEKECAYCKQTLPVGSFSLVSGSDVRRRAGCKECSSRIRFERGLKYVLRKHGLTQAQYDAMLFLQGGRCAICRTEDTVGTTIGVRKRARNRRVFNIDHCHATGKVRGLLCSRCNLAIGNFGDDLELMRAAMTYIETNREEENG